MIAPRLRERDADTMAYNCRVRLQVEHQDLRAGRRANPADEDSRLYLERQRDDLF